MTRLMRDMGFNFFWNDSYCQNMLANGFDLGTTEAPFTAVTMFEVLEHVQSPLSFISETLEMAQTTNLIFSTVLYSDFPPKPEEWSYYCTETGQHISFYQTKTLEWLASKLGLKLYSHGSLHIFTKCDINYRLFRLIASVRIANALHSVVKHNFPRSLTWHDHLAQLGKS